MHRTPHEDEEKEGDGSMGDGGEESEASLFADGGGGFVDCLGLLLLLFFYWRVGLNWLWMEDRDAIQFSVKPKAI